MRKLLFGFGCLMFPFYCQAQLGVTIQGGYTLHSGEHHSEFQSKLLDKTGYDSTKKFTYSSAFKIDYSFHHFNIGLGLEMGQYQTKHTTEIIGISSLIPTTSYISSSAQYLLPQLQVQYCGNITSKITVRTGIMMGFLFSGNKKSNGILVVETDALLGGLIPAQSIGVLAKNGKDASSSSAALAAGAQLEFGYQFNKNFNLNLEWSSKKSTIDAQATVFGINQPVNYSIWLHSIKLGVRYSIHQFPKISLPKMKKKSSNV